MSCALKLITNKLDKNTESLLTYNLLVF